MTESATNTGSGQIRISNVSYSIRDRKGANVKLVDGCSFLAERGKFTALVGPSGCGKSTLMNLLAGYVPADSGSLQLEGIDISGPGWDRLLVFQESALFPWMTTLANISYGPMVRGIKPLREIEKEAAALLDKFGLGEFKERYPSELSGGMQRRAELARALINDPLVLLMDEPFRGLDAMTRQLMQKYLANVFEETRTTTVFVTSEIDEAIFLADRLIVLARAPTRVALEMNVDLPRPRSLEMLSTEPYARLKKAALDMLYSEAVADFSSGNESSDLKEAYERRHA
jgi:sulfonate transport system ATP-binding protein